MEATKWIASKDFLPPDGYEGIGWCDMYGTYEIVTYSPVFGWRTMDGSGLKSITHWLDIQIPFVWKPRNKLDVKIYNEYAGIKEEEEEE